MRLTNQHMNYPCVVYGLIEISQGSNIKYEYNDQFERIEFDRKLKGSMVYPGNYGFIANTLAEDGDPVDIIMLNEDIKIQPNTLIKLKTLGLLEMVDEGEIDYKVICSSLDGNKYNSIEDVNSWNLKSIKDFFKNYKNLENKEVKIGDWQGIKFTHKYLIDKYKNGGEDRI